MHPKSLGRELKGIVKEVLSKCVAVSIIVGGKSSKDVQKDVDVDLEFKIKV